MHYHFDRLTKAYSALEELLNRGKVSELEGLKQQIANSLEMPVSEDLGDIISTHPFILLKYVQFLLQSEHVEKQDHSDASMMKSLWEQVETDPVVVRVRRFSPRGGRYYGVPFMADDGVYTVWDDEPVLVAKVPREWIEELIFGTEIGWISRPEIRLLAALTFSIPAWHGAACYFQPLDEVYDLPGAFVLGSGSSLGEDSLRRIRLAVRVLNRIEMRNPWGFQPVRADISPYRFRTDGIEIQRTGKFYERFNMHDNLMLRTAFLLVRAATLYSIGRSIFAEDATADLFFGLEGALRLIYQVFSGKSGFEHKATLAHIAATFPSKPGYVWMLEDAYEKRVQMVHPEPRNHSSWLPDVAADDFFENYGMATDLFYYAVTGETLPDSD